MPTSKLLYNVGDRPKVKALLLYSFQLLLAILTATIAVPTLIGMPTQIPAAILGGGVGTLVYIAFTKGKSPIVISSSFAYLAAFPTALAFGYLGIVVGGIFSGLIYIIIAIIVKFVGTQWINKLMPPVIVGPVVALIGLSLAGSAMSNIATANASTLSGQYNLIALFCGLVTFFVVVVCSVQNRFKKLKVVPFVVGILVGYLLTSIFTAIGNANNIDALKIINWNPIVNNYNPLTWQSFISVPKISLVGAIEEIINGVPSNDTILAVAANHPELFGGIEIKEANLELIKTILNANNLMPQAITGVGIASVAIAFCPISLVSFAEHLADHKNVSRIIDHDLLNDSPGLHRTLLGDGVGTIAGTVCGICPNTSYGESIACVAMTRNASVITPFVTAIICILLAFIAPFSTALQTIPSCVMGGVCLALYGYISVSGLRMFKDIDLDDNTNLLTVCSILIAGVGGLIIKIPYALNGDGTIAKYVEIGSIATALILGIVTHQVCRKISKTDHTVVAETNLEIGHEDGVRTYLRQFSVDVLAKGLLIFGFMHENPEFTRAQLSNYLRSDEMLNNRSRDELVELINLFELKGYKKNQNKERLVQLIKQDCYDIDRLVVKQMSAPNR